MLRLRIGCLLVPMIWAGSLGAADAPLKFFTPEVDLLVRLHEPDRTVEQLGEMIDQIQPGVGAGLAEQTSVLGNIISVPDLTGVDMSRDWYVGVYASSEGPPEVVFAIPATNPDDLVSALSDRMTSVVKGDWVLYSEADDVPLPESAATAEELLTGDNLEHFQRGNAAAFVNTAHLVDVYAEQLEVLEDRVQEQLNNLRFQAAPEGLNFDAIATLYADYAEIAFRIIRDSRSFCISLSADKSGVAVDNVLTFKSDSTSAATVAQLEPGTLSTFRKLPEGAIAYYGLCGGMKPLMEYAFKMSFSMIGDDQKQPEFEKLTAEFESLDIQSIVASLQIGETPEGVIQACAIGEITPIEKYREISRGFVKLFGTMTVPGMTQEVTLMEGAETFGDLKADVLTLKQTVNPDLDPTGLQDRMRQFMFGPDGLVQRYVYLDNQYLQTMGGGPELMANLIESSKGSGDNDLRPYLSKLFPKYNGVVLLDLPGLAAESLRQVSRIDGAPLPVNEQMVDDLFLRRGYIGAAVMTTPESVRQQLRIPIDQIQGCTKLVILIGSLQRGR